MLITQICLYYSEPHWFYSFCSPKIVPIPNYYRISSDNSTTDFSRRITIFTILTTTVPIFTTKTVLYNTFFLSSCPNFRSCRYYIKYNYINGILFVFYYTTKMNENENNGAKAMCYDELRQLSLDINTLPGIYKTFC